MRTPSRARRPRIAGFGMLAVALIALALAACGGADESSSPKARDVRAVHAPASGPGAGQKSVTGGGGGVTAFNQSEGTAAVAGPQLPDLPDRIVKNADLSLEVRGGAFDGAWVRVFQTATRFGGYVAASSRGRPQPAGGSGSEDDEHRFGDITVRVPAARFEPALNALREIGKVTGDVTSSEDVTQEFVDLESRIRHQRAQEAILVKLMARAGSIQETLVVQNELSKVQLQIEELTGRLNALGARADLSTITVHLAERGAVVGTGDGPSFSKAWSTAVEGLQRIATSFVIVIPLVAPFGLVALAAILWMRRRARRTAPAAAANA